MNAELQELIRQREVIRHDKYEVSEDINDLNTQYDYCTEEHEDEISEQLSVKQAKYDAMTRKEGALVKKIDTLRKLC